MTALTTAGRDVILCWAEGVQEDLFAQPIEPWLGYHRIRAARLKPSTSGPGSRFCTIGLLTRGRIDHFQGTPRFSMGFFRTVPKALDKSNQASDKRLSNVNAINDSGEAVGFYQTADGQNHGFIDDDGSFTYFDDLQTIQASVSATPIAINNSGETTGSS
jgi:probable HAF family extracellular repeat protein